MQENLRTLAFPDLETAGGAACDIVLEEIEKALRALRDARIILAGGTTPRDAYKKLARRIAAGKLPLGRLRWFFGNERWVPREHPRSNEAMAREALLDPLGAPEETVFSWRAGVGSQVEYALRYAETVRRLMGREGSDAGGETRRA